MTPAWKALIVVAVTGMVVEGVVLLGLLRQVGTLLLQMGPARHGEVEGQGPAVGLQVDPRLELPSPAVILFVSPGCSLCPAVTGALPKLRHHYSELSFVPIITGATPDDALAYRARIGPEARLDLNALFSDWFIPGTPFAVATDQDGRVLTSGVVNSLPQLETLSESAIQAVALALERSAS